VEAARPLVAEFDPGDINAQARAGRGVTAGNLELLRTRLAALPGVTLIEPEGTFLAWVDFRGLGLAPDDLTAFLRTEAGWAVTRGPAFGREGEGFARVSIGCRRAALSDALDQLTKAISAPQAR